MLTCTPSSLFSWNFDVSGASSGPAALEFNFFSEQGRITLGGMEYEIRKHGVFSGHWTLERDGRIFAEAHKPSAMFRLFEVSCGGLQLTVKARSVMTRCYHILVDGSVVGTMQPAHVFTRRAAIDCDTSVPELALLFSFWLAVLSWRRAANSNS